MCGRSGRRLRPSPNLASVRFAGQRCGRRRPLRIAMGGPYSARPMDATCQCGQLSVSVPGPSPAVVACHCSYCQRRSGSPFGVLAYYPDDVLTITGEATRFERPTATGGSFETYFCPTCGSTVYARAGKHPSMLGIAVGAFADPTLPAPVRSVWEQGKYHWVTIPAPAEHFPQGRS